MTRTAKKLAAPFAAIIIAGFAGWLGQPVIHGNSAAIDVIVTVFSILSGFLVAIIAIVGDPSLLPAGSWRIKHISREGARQRLIRQKWLFRSYLMTLALIFASMIIDESHQCLIIWVERLYLALGTLVFLFSLVLPGVLTRVQIEKMDEIIRNQKAGQ